MVSAQSIISRSESVLHSELDSQIILLNIESGEYYDIDPVGSNIWLMIEQPKSVDNICEGLMKSYDVTPQLCNQDVVRFIEELAELGALEVS